MFVSAAEFKDITNTSLIEINVISSQGCSAADWSLLSFCGYLFTHSIYYGPSPQRVQWRSIAWPDERTTIITWESVMIHNNDHFSSSHVSGSRTREWDRPCYPPIRESRLVKEQLSKSVLLVFSSDGRRTLHCQHRISRSGGLCRLRLSETKWSLKGLLYRRGS